MTKPLAERLAAIDTLVLDVDGVLSDGGVIYNDQGAETKRFHVRDGSALRWWHDLGFKSIIVSGRDSKVVERRAKELGVTRVLQGISDKSAALDKLAAEGLFVPERSAGMGDDLPDLPMLRRCAVSIAPADACAELLAAVDHVTKLEGGQGTVREAIEWILRAQGRWAGVVARFDKGGE